MAGFRFNKDKTFKDNLEDFLQHMEAEDKELGALLRGQSSRLEGCVDDTRRKKARADFNTEIKKSIAEKLKPSVKEQ